MTMLPDGRRSANIFMPHMRHRQRGGIRGAVDGLLRRLGPVTRNSPIRRLLQLVFFGLFMYAFVVICWPYAERFTTGVVESKAFFPVDSFLLLDPLQAISTALAGRFVNPTTWLWCAAILIGCLLVPRAFCGYICPLGTLIDGFDWLIGRHFQRFHLPDNGRRKRWSHAKYGILVAVLVASLCGFLAAGWCAAIPVVTRGMLLTVGRLQLAWLKGRNQLLPLTATGYLSVALFVGILLLGLRGRRFWCRYLCPTGAVFSVLNVLRIGQRQVESTCIACGRCLTVCPFDAIAPDFTTHTADCTWCQTCGGSCPTHAIKFVTRWNRDRLLPPELPEPGTATAGLSRRGFVTAVAGGAAYGLLSHVNPAAGKRTDERPVRPPGSVPEPLFLDLCIRCGQCIKVCPGPVLHPAGMSHGLDALWTPIAHLTHAGCHQDCNACTLVCPTGAIRPLPIDVKRHVKIGLAHVDTQTCLPYRQRDRQTCDLCFQECESAGYAAIQMQWLHIPLDPPPPEGMFSDQELEEMSRIRVPRVDLDRCVGCGICQYRCHMHNVTQEHLLAASAIAVSACGDDRRTSFTDA